MRDLPAHRRTDRHGTIYVMILGVSMLLAVIAFGVLSTDRLRSQQVALEADADEAGHLAFSAIEQAMTVINRDNDWRTRYGNDAWCDEFALGRGRVAWKIVDEADGNLGNDATQPVRVYGRARVRQAMRTYSIQVPGTPAYNALETAMYAAKDVISSSNVALVGGPLSTSGVFTSGASTTGNVEAASVINPVTVYGKIISPPPVRRMPPASAFDEYDAMATVIPYNKTNNGAVANLLLSATNNYISGPSGDPNPHGVYRIDVPAGKVLTFTSCRIVATLLITLEEGTTVTFRTCQMEAPAGQALVIVKAAGTGGVVFSGAVAPLREWASVCNFNPPGTPYQGVEDNDQLDTYPQETIGLVHVIGASTTTTISQTVLKGVLITEGAVTFSANNTFTRDANIFLRPPRGYSDGNVELRADPATWRWEVGR